MAVIQWITLDDSPKLRSTRDAVVRFLEVILSPKAAPELPPTDCLLFDAKRLTSVHQYLREHRDPKRKLVLGASVSGHLSSGEIVELLAAGAEDLFEFGNETLPAEAARLRGLVERWHELERVVDSATASGMLVGASARWRETLRRIAEAALSPTTAVHIFGETGTGKEAAARLVHDLGPRKEGPWIAVDCAASVDSLFVAELFGCKKGAFTGAVQDRVGHIARAHGGTLFLDEVGELRPAMQAALLRAIQERSYTPIGSTETRRSEFRVVSATNRDLASLIETGGFRRDLYHRIGEFVCELPPLRERKQDIPLLLRHFLAAHTSKDVQIDSRVEQWLMDLPWSGNVRELRGVAQAIAGSLNGASEVKLSHLPRAILRPGIRAAREPAQERAGLRGSIQQVVVSGRTLNQILDTVRDEAVRAAVDLAGGRSAEAADRLGVSERMVQLRRRSWVHSLDAPGESLSQELQTANETDAG